MTMKQGWSVTNTASAVATSVLNIPGLWMRVVLLLLTLLLE
jgi:hypothetical protein